MQTILMLTTVPCNTFKTKVDEGNIYEIVIMRGTWGARGDSFTLICALYSNRPESTTLFIKDEIRAHKGGTIPFVHRGVLTLLGEHQIHSSIWKNCTHFWIR